MLAGKLRTALASDVDRGDLRGGEIDHPARVASHAHEISIMQHDDLVVLGVLHVEFGVVGPGVHRRPE